MVVVVVGGGQVLLVGRGMQSNWSLSLSVPFPFALAVSMTLSLPVVSLPFFIFSLTVTSTSAPQAEPAGDGGAVMPPPFTFIAFLSAVGGVQPVMPVWF